LERGEADEVETVDPGGFERVGAAVFKVWPWRAAHVPERESVGDAGVSAIDRASGGSKLGAIIVEGATQRRRFPH
jgi:hypothetical protein